MEVRISKARRRKAETQLQVLLVAADVAAIVLAVALAYGLRFHSLLSVAVPVTKGVPPLGLYLRAALLVALVWLPLFASLGLYRSRNRLDFPSQFDLGLHGVGLGSLLALALTFFYRGASFSRLVLPLACGLALLLVPALRVWFGGWFVRRALPATGVAVVGSGAAARSVAARLERRAPPGSAFAGLSGADADGLEAVVAAARAGVVGRVLLALEPGEAPRAGALIAALAALEVEIDWVPVLPELHAGRLRVESFEGLPVIPLGEFPLLGWNAVAKRGMDVTLSALGLLALAPLLAGVALAVRLSSPGPVIYRQERIGRDGRRFGMLKFRSMRADAEADSGPVRTARNDPRITPVGRILRRTSLDELPQLWNVLRGAMSLVGPRPERPALVDELVGEIPDYLRRHRVKSGMTGWAQVHGLRGADTSMRERVLCDLYYIEHWSVWLDLRILLRTVLGLFREPNAY